MVMCCVIGSIASASSTASLLRSRGISSKAFEAGSDNDKLFEACRAEKDLRVAAVFLKSIKKDVPAFLRSLRESLSQGVRIHVLWEGSRDSLSDFSRGIADEVTVAFPLGPAQAEKVLNARWFRAVKKPEEDEGYTKRTGGTAAWNHTDQSAAKASLETFVSNHPTTATPRKVSLAQLESYKASQGGGDTAVAEETKVVSKSVGATPMLMTTVAPTVVLAAPAVPIARVVAPALKGKESGKDALEVLLEGVQKNKLLPVGLVRASIVGKGGTSVEIDPRRVRPLPRNPRHKDNEGFTEESLGELGEKIRTFGQLEDGSVCPIVDDPQYDAQLIDGERRHGGCLRARVMFRVKVREDVTPSMARKLYILSVVGNTGKAPHTTLEYVDMVRTFRGPEFNMTRAQIAKTISKSVSVVDQYEKLATLHPEVLSMVGENRPSKSKGSGVDGEENKRKLTSQLGLLLAEVPRERQLMDAQKIISQGMNYNQARRYILGVRRDLQIKRDTKNGWQGKAFRALGTLTRRSTDAFGVVGDMTVAEMSSLLANRSKGECSGVAQDLRSLADNLCTLADRIEATAVAKK
ncbi:MAG: hypothetical protein WAV50_03550 [Minisyncoccia bacterium]